MIYNVVLVSGVQQSDSVIHTYVYIYSFSDSFPNNRLLQNIGNNRNIGNIGYYRILSRVPCTVGPC